ncbi:MAG: hypothetical protein WD651_12585 [Acidimicrobiia bacterium]
MVSVPDEPSTAPIRFGIMCNGHRFPAWQASAIRALLALEGVEVGLLIIAEQLAASGPSKLRRLRDWPRLIWNLFNKGYVERRSIASRPTDLASELSGTPEIHCGTERVGRYAERFSPDDIAAVASCNLDFILRFGFGVIKGEILTTPRWGVWSFHHGDERSYRGRPPGFWELVAGEKVVGSILQRLTERLDAGVILYRGFFKATAHSYLRTRDDLFLGSSEWPRSVLQALRKGDDAAASASPSTTEAAVRRDPTNGVMLRFLARQAVEFVKSQWRGLTAAATWTVGVVEQPIARFLDGGLPSIRWIREPGRNRYLADPFSVFYKGSLWALVEDYDYGTHRGVISAVVLDDNDAQPRTVLDIGVHASYPYLFELNGDFWCVPETYQAGEVRLYQAVNFPHEWRLHATLIKGVAALDSTLVRHGDRWWLFCTDRDDGPNTKLRIWHAHDLAGPWTPHPLNPVKTDVRSSRPAGTPFAKDGILYRPAQDGSESYGGSIAINRIDLLTPTAFSEEVVATVHPPPQGRYRDGLHTICAVGEKTVIDGRRDSFITAAFLRELGSRLRKVRGS